ncbi:MAG: glycoside hydrolase family 73 protein [Aureispira sp.]
MSQHSFFSILLLSFLVVSCQFTQSTTTSTPNSGSMAAANFKITGPSNAVAYVEKYKRMAVSERLRTGIPASIKLAQGILESGYGSSTLAQKANNHFGIKCGSGWSGKTIQYKGSCYRIFKNGTDAYKEHSNFLTGSKRYESLFQLKRTDYKGWARGLRQAGYATNPKYPAKLIELIERYKLYNYDK